MHPFMGDKALQDPRWKTESLTIIGLHQYRSPWCTIVFQKG